MVNKKIITLQLLVSATIVDTLLQCANRADVLPRQLSLVNYLMYTPFYRLTIVNPTPSTNISVGNGPILGMMMLGSIEIDMLGSILHRS